MEKVAIYNICRVGQENHNRQHSGLSWSEEQCVTKY
jgi:hypothetical protein